MTWLDLAQVCNLRRAEDYRRTAAKLEALADEVGEAGNANPLRPGLTDWARAAAASFRAEADRIDPTCWRTIGGDAA